MAGPTRWWPAGGATLTMGLVSPSGGQPSGLESWLPCRLPPRQKSAAMRLYPARLPVGVIDVGFAKSRGDARHLARLVRQFDLSHFRLGEGQALPIQNCLGRRRIIHHDTNQAFAFGRKRLEGENIHTASQPVLDRLSRGLPAGP